MTTKSRATIEDLYRLPPDQKAELVHGEIVQMAATGRKPGRAGMRIAVSLSRHEEQVGGGYAFPDNVGFIVSLPHRESFSPDAPDRPTVFRRGDSANAEPAVPGWKMNVNDLFV